VLLLADIFQEFRIQTRKSIDIDPLHYISLPSMSFDGAVKKAKESCEPPIDLVTDPDMYIMFERGIRGGVSQISHRYAKANNPYLEGYDATKPTSYIMYVDANNLYGWSMMENLPVSHFEWCNPTIEEVLTGNYSCNNGMLVECDLEYPEDLHDLHNDLPLAPERIELGYADASSTSHEAFTSKIPTKKSEKLCGHFRPRKNYVVHARVLQFYVNHGMKLTKIHRAIKCLQSTFLKPWIDMNSANRAVASNDFEKDLYKLLNNAVFGKKLCKTNVHKRMFGSHFVMNK
jgi:hypothetical protein